MQYLPNACLVNASKIRTHFANDWVDTHNTIQMTFSINASSDKILSSQLQAAQPPGARMSAVARCQSTCQIRIHRSPRLVFDKIYAAQCIGLVDVPQHRLIRSIWPSGIPSCWPDDFQLLDLSVNTAPSSMYASLTRSKHIRGADTV